jgi:hypothetical protein
MNRPTRACLAALVAATAVGAFPDAAAARGKKVASIDVLAPGNGDRVGVGGSGWIVDLAIRFDLPARSLPATGFTAPQLTGPGVHNNVAPLPGTFAPGKDDRLPGLVVLLSTTAIAAGPGQNLANVFNLTGVNDLKRDEIKLWDTWIVGSPGFGTGGARTTLRVALVGDLNSNGVYDDAPDVVRDADSDGDVDDEDLKALGLASNVRTVRFFIN